MKEIIYAMERDYLERYLKEKSACTLDEMKTISELRGAGLFIPGSDEAINQAAADIYSVDGNTAYIKITGALSPDGPDIWDLFWGYSGTSYKAIQAAIEKAKNDIAVEKVVFQIDSPGGTVSGVDETWQAHKALNDVKPTEVYAGSLLASAAYYISTPADKILAPSPMSEIGSIGVLVATYDWSKWEENIGIREVVITSSNAPDKHPDISTKKGRDTIKNQLDAMERNFYERVAEGRDVTNEHIAEHFGKGGLLVAQDPSAEHEDAISVKMIDGLISDTSIAETKNERLTQEEIETIIRAIDSQESDKNTPAPAGKTQEGQNMDLSEVLKANPAAAAEIEKLKSEAKTEGEREAKAAFAATVERVMPIITSENYPSNIKALAGEVIAGKKGIDAFDAAVTIYDTNKENQNSADAQGHTQELGAVTADSPSLTPAAEKELDAAIKAEIDKRKAS